MSVCEDCWREARRRYECGEGDSLPVVYALVVKEAEAKIYQGTPAPWCKFRAPAVQPETEGEDGA